MSFDIWNYFLITIFVISTKINYASANIHIDHKKENLVSDIRNTDGVVFTSISENVEPDLFQYSNEAEVQIHLQKPAEETRDDKIVFSISKTKTDSNFNWFIYATSKGSTREETIHVLKETSKKEEILDVKGTYSYVGNDGVRYITGYTAGKNGYRPKVLFGTKVKIEELPSLEVSDRVNGEDNQKAKGFGGSNDLMCSLIGSGC